jgi:fatty-acyl-CoA synthase
MPDERVERPLAVVVRAPGASVTPQELHDFLADRVAAGSCPNGGRSSTSAKTSVRKFDKKAVSSATPTVLST